MTIVKLSHNTDNDNERVVEGWINLKIQLSRKTIVTLVGTISTFCLGFGTGAHYMRNPGRHLPPSEVSQSQIEQLCVRQENEGIFCFDRLSQNPISPDDISIQEERNRSRTESPTAKSER